jgi:hypothetical protein
MCSPDRQQGISYADDVQSEDWEYEVYGESVTSLWRGVVWNTRNRTAG